MHPALCRTGKVPRPESGYLPCRRRGLPATSDPNAYTDADAYPDPDPNPNAYTDAGAAATTTAAATGAAASASPI